MSTRLEHVVPITANSGSAVDIIAHVVCDAQSDLPAVNAYTGYVLAMGCTAKVIADGTDWMLNSGGTWVQQPAGVSLDLTGYYTSAQVDSIVNGLQPLLTFDPAPVSMSTNPVTSGGVFAALWSLTDIANGTDLDTLQTLGIYRCRTGTITDTLSHCPITGGNGFRLVVNRTSHTTKFYQFLMPAALTDADLYLRKYDGSVWGSWYKFTGTPV